MDDQGSAPTNRTHVDAPERDLVLSAFLSLSGEIGYRQATVERIAARAHLSPGYFYSRFSGREECFAIAYQTEAEPLVARMLKAGREAQDFADGIGAALTELIGFAIEEPPVARAILAEVYVAGGDAKARHEQNLRRLSDAAAGTRRESHPSRHDPPPVTAAFIVGGLEEVVRRRLGERRPELLSEELPDLVAFAAAPFEQRPSDD
jgi:AcrR family transcriptional regulator